MGFLIFIPLILIGGLAGMLLEKIVTPFLPLLELLLDPTVFRVTMGVLLAVNVLFLVLLMTVRSRWAREGRMDRAYADSFRGWERFKAATGRNVLIFAIVWEFMMVFLLVGALVFSPLLPDSGQSADTEDPVHFLWGTWEITSCAAVTPYCRLSQEELDGYVGTQVHYNGYDYKKNGEVYTKTALLLTGDTEYSITKVMYKEVDAEDFEFMFHLSLADLGEDGAPVFYAVIHFEGDDEEDMLLGQRVFSVGDTVYLYHEDALFLAEEALFYGGPLIGGR